MFCLLKTMNVCEPNPIQQLAVILTDTLVCRIDVHARLLILRKKFPLHGLIWPCTFIVFEKKNPPARLFFCVYKGICPARLLILRKKSPLHGLIWVCTFNVFLRIFPPARLFCPTRLFGTLE